MEGDERRSEITACWLLDPEQLENAAWYSGHPAQVRADELRVLAAELRSLRHRLAAYARADLARSVAHLPIQGPCLKGDFDLGPHLFEHVPKSDSLSKCIRCGWVIGK
jgi:hypothetical protein